MTLSRFLSAAALSLAFLSAPSAHADTPPFFPVQGVLTDADGAAVDGTVSVRFALYDALDATAALWEETRTLDVTAGAFTTYLGESVDLAPGVFRDQGSLWLGVTVESDEEMERVELGSAAYAAVAQHALEVPADVVRGDQSCGAGEVVSGLDAGGAVVCVADADADTVYSGADFALADQSCGPGDVVAGVDAAGDVVCVADGDQDTQLTEAQVDGYVANNNYSTGVRGGQRKQGVCVVGAASVDTQWEVAVLEPTDVAQLESEGKPVLANAFFALKHCSTQV